MTAARPERPTVFALHGLGLSGRLFDRVGPLVSDDLDLRPLDLPGFGTTPASVGTVEQTADWVIDRIRDAIEAGGVARWLLVGHSMGAKIASVVAARTLAGEAPVFGLSGVLLLAGSPPTPEPMSEDRRAEMIGWAGRGGLDDRAARTFVDANVGAPLDPADDALVLDDLHRCSPEAWRAWLERGSREDWSEQVGTLDLPALIMAGGADGDLGPDAQRELNGPVYPRAEVVTLPGAGHLLPLERPDEVGRALIDFWRRRAGRGPSVPPRVAAVIGSDRTSARTRAALAGRALPDDPDAAPRVLDAPQLATLRLLAELIVPQDGDPIDLAARVDAALDGGAGDGWRRAGLPADVDCYRAGLDALAGIAGQDPEGRRRTLDAVAAGEHEVAGSRLSPEQLGHWFEDLCVDLVRPYVTHPATMARIGFDGYANGGDLMRQQGFQLVGAGERESWEPLDDLPGGRR